MYIIRIGTLSTVAGFILASCGGSHGANGGVGANVLPQTSAVRPFILTPTTSRGVRRERLLYIFKGGKDGAGPVGSLIHMGGTFYGTTQEGGSSRCNSPSFGAGCGTVFELVSSGTGYTERVLHRFQGDSDGEYPWAGLTAGRSGVLFGTTQYGGNSSCTNSSLPAGCGTVFKLTPSARGYTKSTIYAFKGGADGFGPLGALLTASGILYGTTEFGGNAGCTTTASGCGTVFKLTPSGHRYVKTIIYDFAGGSDGANPYGSLIVDGTGALYGTTGHGGNATCYYGCGTAFELAPSKTGYSERVLHRFKGGNDGQWPKAGLMQDASGAFYGTTEGGGGTPCANGGHLNGCGTLFKLTPARGKYSESILYPFQGTSDGAWPYSGLVADANGTLYGATWLGGNGGCSISAPPGCGVVFKLTGTGTNYSTVYAFKGGTDGAAPLSAPILVKGLLYGTTTSGAGTKCSSPSSSGCGAVYALRP